MTKGGFHELQVKLTGSKRFKASASCCKGIDKLTNGEWRFPSTGNHGSVQWELHDKLFSLQKHISNLGTGRIPKSCTVGISKKLPFPTNKNAPVYVNIHVKTKLKEVDTANA